jgi:hypothetical protein
LTVTLIVPESQPLEQEAFVPYTYPLISIVPDAVVGGGGVQKKCSCRPHNQSMSRKRKSY